MRKPTQSGILPIWGYVALNLVFLTLMGAIYYGSLYFASTQNFRSAGLFPVLMVCYGAFTFVCIFDAAYDRLSGRTSRLKERKPEQTQIGKDS